MASKKSSKKRKGKSKAIKVPVIVIVAIVVIAVILAVLYVADVGGSRAIVDKLIAQVLSVEEESGSNLSGNNNSNANNNSSSNNLGGEDLSVHFLELGNKFTGDCVLLDCGDVEILIDAGSRKNSATTIKQYVDQYCSDGILEYVIATHAHQDHIAGFVSGEKTVGIFEAYECKTIIDFALTNASSDTYNAYVEARDKEVQNGAKHYTAAECIKGVNGAKAVYRISDSVTMTILDSYYYYNLDEEDENNHSVCVLITNGEQHYLFTGDLEKDGEKKLVEMNDLPHCELFKGGHHGSYTASTDVLLSAITPDTICICCCIDSTEYTKNMDHTFPAVESLERMVKYTTEIYATTIVKDDGTFGSFNGNIVVKCVDGKLTVNCSNNNVPLPKTEWCKKRRPTVYCGA